MAGYIRVTKRFTFEAAHTLPKYNGPCRRMHGHSYKLEVTVGLQKEIESTTDLDDQGMVIDFTKLKYIVKRTFVDRVDHTYLNESLPIKHTTAEAILFWLAENLRREVDETYPRIRLERLCLWETEDSYAEWVW